MPEIYRGDIYGLREHKYGTLGTTGVTNTEWAEVEPMSPFYLFAEVDAAAAEEYVKGVSLPYIAPVNNVGIVTSRDRFVVDYSLDDLKRRIYDFLDANKTDAEVANKYLSAKDKLDVSEAREVINKRGRHTFAEVSYRPFDIRWLFYEPEVIERPRPEIMRHMFAGANLALIINRQTKPTYNHVFFTEYIFDFHILETAHANPYLYPIYVYSSAEKVKAGDRRPNLSPEFVESFLAAVGAGALENSPEVGQRSGSREVLYPEDIFYYIYGVLHSPTYRERYAEFLKLDFPRIPFPKDYESFDRLAAAGRRLAELHLLKDKDRWRWQGIEQRGDAKEAVVGKVEYDEKNEEIIFDAKKPPDERYRIGPVPKHIWEFHVGGYQVLSKWLKDRKGRKVAPGDYVAIIIALTETDRIMKEDCDPAFREMLGL